MKTFWSIIFSAPKKDTIELRAKVNDKWVEYHASEEQFRWLQLNIALGEFPNSDVVVVQPDGEFINILPGGRPERELVGVNTLSLNRELAFKMWDLCDMVVEE